jgi:hypothetical protein
MRVADRHAESIKVSSFLSKLPVIGREQKEDVKRMAPEELIPLLQNAGVDFVLAGAHGIAGWMAEPRATQDVDFIIRIRDKQKATDALLAKHPNLEIEKHPDVWRFKSGEQYVVDLILTRAPLFRRVIKEFKTTRIGKREAKVPKLEAALAMKFASMTGHWRKLEKKYSDASDFASMARHNPAINEGLLRELGELVYPGGGVDLVRYVEDVRAGRKLEI